MRRESSTVVVLIGDPGHDSPKHFSDRGHIQAMC